MKKTIGLIFGGNSNEHEVSLKSALSFLQNVDYTKYSVVPFMIDSQGKWLQYSRVFEPVESLNELWLDSQINISPLFPWNKKIDIFFPLIHGDTGEDGKLQGFLEMCGVPYVGCGVESSAVGMNKLLSKIVVSEEIDVVPYQVIRKSNSENAYAKGSSFGYPVFVKPVRAGSSVGVTKAYNHEQFKLALDVAFSVDNTILVEKFIDGKEVEVAVIGNPETIEISQVGEIEFMSDFYDYENKYNAGTSVMHIPARIEDIEISEIKDMAKKVYMMLGCEGYARIDFFVEKKDGMIYFNEINTSPGMTSQSMFPVLFSDKYSFKDLLTKIIQSAAN